MGKPMSHTQPGLEPTAGVGGRGEMLSHPLVSQAVALPVSWDRGCGEAASNRCIRTGGPPAEPRRAGAGGGACEQNRERESNGWSRLGRLRGGGPSRIRL